MLHRLAVVLLAMVLASALAANASAGMADVDSLLRLEQHRSTAAGPEAWAQLYPVPPDRPPLMASG